MAPPRKTAPRKAAPRKAARPKAAPSPHRAEIEAFEEFRDRARRSGLSLVTREPFAVPGFDPPVHAHWPKSLAAREEFDQAVRHLNVFSALRITLGDDYARVLAAFDALDDGETLLIGLYMRIIDHFNGPGASDVPGGSPAS